MSIPDKIPNINKETSNAVMLITDPYHDYNLQAVGYPDGTSLISAIQRRYGRTTIQNPFNLQPGDTWNFHIYTTPLHYKETLKPATLAGNTFTYASAGGTVSQGPINIQYWHWRGSSLINTAGEVLGADTPYASVNMAQVRTVSFGYELHNTTAEIQRSGSLTVYRAPIDKHDINMFIRDGSGPASNYGCTFLVNMPTSIELATNFPNTRTWEASKGVYSVCLPAPCNEYSPSVPTNMCLKTGTIATDYLLKHVGSVLSTAFSTYSPLSCTGVWSSKYSTDQTFTLDFRQVLEIQPNGTATVDMSFASTCPPIDRLFMKLYKNMFSQIPPGVPVSMNAAGDWVRSILKIAKGVLPSLGAMPGIFGKIAQAATPIVYAIDSAVGQPNVTNRTVTNKQLKTAMSKPLLKRKLKRALTTKPLRKK